MRNMPGNTTNLLITFLTSITTNLYIIFLALIITIFTFISIILIKFYFLKDLDIDGDFGDHL